ncbi:MAG: flagellar biosynthesis protein FlgD [Rhodospirillales bacterium 20-64-7]|nr:MAG: flagellar biosynthesis protein FlgD [Rhodospirillales bacterium 20-64-7]HQT75434.1 flagellar hook capping FlgD N-terminal domain-containing protein [Rhodopila sp.]
MSGSVTPTSGTTASGGTSAISQVGTSALGSLSDNFSTFLNLLMTQLKNQDPTSPLDANQFTSELVQFSSVEQQINTNTDLAQLIQLTQASQVEQSSSMLGKPVTINSSQLSLQNGQAKVNFSTSASEPVTIAVYNASGVQVQSATVTSSVGPNTWTWNGQSASGATLPDGAYTVTATTASSTGTTTQVPFTITGTATAVTNNAGTVDLSMGSLSVPFSNVQSVGN